MPATDDAIKCLIRPAIFRDLDEVSMICGWSAAEINKTLKDSKTVGLVAEHHDAILGVLFFERHADALVLIGVATHPTHRRRGIASQMLGFLASHANRKGRRIDMDVDEYDVRTQLLLKSCGFEMATIHRCPLGTGDVYQFSKE
jgi:ribosomal protein S18 acetylase RimI-like enzyme